MKYYLLNPEVAGELGDGSEVEYENGRIKEVKFLEYNFMGWLGDELLTTHPCFIVTKSLQEDIILAGLTGMVFSEIKITVSDVFVEIYGDRHIPEFVRIICSELYETNVDNLQHDFYYNEYKDLIVSERALDVIKQHKISMCTIEEYN